ECWARLPTMGSSGQRRAARRWWAARRYETIWWPKGASATTITKLAITYDEIGSDCQVGIARGARRSRMDDREKRRREKTRQLRDLLELDEKAARRVLAHWHHM